MTNSSSRAEVSARPRREKRRRHRGGGKRQAAKSERRSDCRGEKRRHRGSRAAYTVDIPPVGRDFACHVCGRNHWTVECPKVRRHPEDYPLIDRKKGCWQCGLRGHNASECKKRKYRCKECGGLHDTKDCVYDHVSEEWYEFVDPVKKHVFYCNADESEVQWMPPTHNLDVVLWYCPRCFVMNPSQYSECVKCRECRPSVALAAAGSKDDSSSSSGSDSSDDSGSSSSDSDSESDDGDGSVSEVRSSRSSAVARAAAKDKQSLTGREKERAAGLQRK